MHKIVGYTITVDMIFCGSYLVSDYMDSAVLYTNKHENMLTIFKTNQEAKRYIDTHIMDIENRYGKIKSFNIVTTYA
jgi:hypothetical protein